jgi:hypothetical protein
MPDGYRLYSKINVVGGGTPLLHTWIADALVEDGRVTGIVVANKSGRPEIRAKVIVDATGDGDVAARAGAAHSVGNGAGKAQPATLMFDMTGVDTARVKQYMDDHLDDFEWASEFVPVSPYSDRLPQQHFVGQGFLDLVATGLREDRLHLGRDSILFLTTTQHGVLHFNSTRVADVDATDAESLTRGEIEGRRQVMSLSSYLIETVPGCERAALAGTGTALGIRESRHVTGEYVLAGAAGRISPAYLADAGTFTGRAPGSDTQPEVDLGVKPPLRGEMSDGYRLYSKINVAAGEERQVTWRR